MTAPTLDPTPSTAAEPFSVGGRTFRIATETTMRQDGYIWTLQQQTGIDQLLKEFDPAKDLSEFTMALIAKAYDDGHMFELLGAIVEEVGPIKRKWTLDAAKERAEFFAELTSAQDKVALRHAMSAVILGFFVSGLLSSGTSAKSSTVSLSPLNNASDSVGAVTDSPEAAPISATGAVSSASSPASTSADTTRSSTGT